MSQLRSVVRLAGPADNQRVMLVNRQHLRQTALNVRLLLMDQVRTRRGTRGESQVRADRLERAVVVTYLFTCSAGFLVGWRFNALSYFLAGVLVH